MKITARNRNIFPLSLAIALIAMNNSYAESTVKVYGRANITLNNIEKESSNPVVNEWQLNSNSSRLGVNGSYAINGDLKAIYKMEYEVHIDDGNSSSSKGSDTFEQRNIFVGFEGNFGRLIAGKHDTPLKLAQGKIDRFNDQVLGDIKNYIEGEDRASNIVMYTTPTINGFSSTAALIPAEDSTGSSNNGGLSDGTSISLNYKNSWLTTAVAHNSEVDNQDTTRLVADIKMGNTKVGALWQEAEKIDGSSKEDSWLISGEKRLNNGLVLKAQYGQTDYNNHKEDSQWVLGIDKNLNKSTKIFGYYAQIKKDDGTNSKDDSSFGIGYELKF